MRHHNTLLTIFLAAAATYSGCVSAQVPDASDREAAKAHRKAEGRAAARGPQLGEGDPIPEARERSSQGARATGKAQRRKEGADAAKETTFGEGDGIPEPAARVAPADRAAARQARRAEAARANKAGEIKSKGESSY